LKGASWGCSGIWSGCFPDASLGRCFGHVPAAVGLRDRPKTHCRDFNSWLAWEIHDVPMEGLEKVAREKEVWGSLLRLPPQPRFE